MRGTTNNRSATAVGWLTVAVLAAAGIAICGAPRGARAFVTLRPETTDLESAARWAAAPDPAVGGVGLFDGIEVAIEPGLAEKLARAVTGETRPEDVAAVEASVRAAFAAWESSVLRFRVTFDGPVERGATVGAEIDVFVVPDSDPVFQGNAFFGVTDTAFEMVEGRVLTNGDVLPGFAISGADIFLNQDTIAGVSTIFTRAQQPAALQRLITHETGHALGFGHPVDFAAFNYDTDDDPLNRMVIDPRRPLADLRLSPNVNPNAVMSNSPTTKDALLLTTLTNDDRGGRDALYPGPPDTDCAADCDANGAVSIDELVRAVRIALGEAFFLACPAADRDRDLHVAIDELVAGVRGSLEGCAQPDLVPTTVRPSEFVEPPDLPDFIEVCVANRGAARSAPFTVQVEFPEAGDAGTTEFAALDAGAEQCEHTVYDFFEADVVVDPDNAVRESDESNNAASFFVPIP